jgi:hypothetical protein
MVLTPQQSWKMMSNPQKTMFWLQATTVCDLLLGLKRKDWVTSKTVPDENLGRVPDSVPDGVPEVARMKMTSKTCQK